MNIAIRRAFPMLLSGLLVIQPGFAAGLDKEKAAEQCTSISKKLYQLTEVKEGEPCTPEVSYSGWVMKVAAMLVKSEDYQRSIVIMEMAERVLHSVHESTERCPWFSPLVLPMLMDIRHLKHELKEAT